MSVKVGDIIVLTDPKKAFNGPEDMKGIETEVTRVESYGIYTKFFGIGIYLNHGSFIIKKP